MTDVESQAPALANRRGGDRAETAGVVFCWRAVSPGGSLGVAMRAESLDLSQAGARLGVRRKFAVGEALELEFLGGSGDRAAFRTLASVRWAREEAPGHWQIGCQFAKPVGLGSLLELLR